MKRIIGILSLIGIAVLLMALISDFICYIMSDRILVIGYRGLENLFHAPYSYHCVKETFCNKYPSLTARLHYQGKDISYSFYQDDSTLVYYVSLNYETDTDQEISKEEGAVRFPYNNDYVLYYEGETSFTRNALNEIDEIVAETAKSLYDLKQSVYTNKVESSLQNDDSEEIDSYLLYLHGQDVMIENSNTIYSYDGKRLKKLMDLPEKGTLDYIIWDKN